MKKNLYSAFILKILILGLLLITGGIFRSYGQTTLNKGDMAVIGIKVSGGDFLKIVTLVNLAPGTKFSITDNAWTGSNFCSAEMGMEFTVNCAQIPAGTVMSIDVDGLKDDEPSSGNMPSDGYGTLSCGGDITWTRISGLYGSEGFGFDDDGGDNVFIFQGTYNASPTFIHAFLSKAATTTSCSADQSDQDVDNTSLNGTGLTAGTNAVVVSNSTTRHVKCANMTGTTKAALFTAINTTTNWQTSGDALVTDCTFSGLSVDCSKIISSCISCTASNTTTNASKKVPANTITWTNPNSVNVLVVAWENTPPVGGPTNGTTSYSAGGGTFTSGTAIGTGGHVVYKGTSTKINSDITGFTAASDPVNYAVFEVVTNCGAATTCYVPSNSNCLSSLPVNLIYQSAVKEAGKYIVEWSTASETNSAYYEIQASPDGTSFVYIDQYAAKMNTSALSVYQALFASTDNYPYIRIKQVDIDGKYEYFDIMSVKEEISNEDFEIFPIPATDKLFVRSLSSVVSENNMVANYSITSIVGNVLQDGTFDFDAEHIVKPVDVSGLDAGTYLLTIQLSDRRIMKRFVIE